MIHCNFSNKKVFPNQYAVFASQTLPSKFKFVSWHFRAISSDKVYECNKEKKIEVDFVSNYSQRFDTKTAVLFFSVILLKYHDNYLLNYIPIQLFNGWYYHMALLPQSILYNKCFFYFALWMYLVISILLNYSANIYVSIKYN